jgi:arylsulfatase A-like enzyme
MKLRRTFSLLASIGLLLGVGLASEAGAKTPAKQPNIVYIIADDQGWADVGYHGSDIKTPNIDALANGGMRLEQFHAQPLCTQTRSALMTGRYPYRTGMQSAVIPSNGTYGLDTDERTLPQALKDAGYYTAMVGKWHIGHADQKYWPRQRGFDYHFGAVLGEIDYFTHSAHGKTDWYRDNELVHEEGYATDLLGDDAVRLIRQYDGKKPMFLYLAFTAPHSPFQAPEHYQARNPRITEPTRRAYAGMITALDDQVGRVVAELKKRGMLEDTLIVYQSDNGGVRSSKFAGEADVSKLVLPASNGPYRDGKGTLYEGGTRVIALANWKGHIKPGTVNNGQMHVVDVYPTLIKLAGGSLEQPKPIDGIDMGPMLTKGLPSPRTTTIYSVEPQQAAVLKDGWKLVWRTTLPSSVELFELAKDPYEQNNLAAANPAKVAELQQLVEAEAKTAAPSKFIANAFGAMMPILFGATNLPGQEGADEHDIDAIP